MKPDSDRELLHAVLSLRRKVVSKVAQKKGLRVSRKTNATIESGSSLDQVLTTVFAEGKRTFLPRRKIKTYSPYQDQRDTRGTGEAYRDRAAGSSRTLPSKPEINDNPKRKRKILLGIVLVVVAASAVAIAYWWPVITTGLLPQS